MSAEHGSGGGGRRPAFRRLLSRAAAAAGRGGPSGRPAVDAEWAGRRWFEMRVGYGTYMAFMFGFANFILLLHGLTDWFKDYPLHWFVLATVAVIVPVSVLVGHRHNRTQQKTETRRLTHLSPYINLLTPRSKEVFLETQLHAMIDLMISTTRNPELRSELAGLRAALGRYMGGETASASLDKEGVRRPFPGPSGFAVAPPSPAPPAARGGAGPGAGGDRAAAHSSPPPPVPPAARGGAGPGAGGDRSAPPSPPPSPLERRKAAARDLVSPVGDSGMLRDIFENSYGRNDTSASWIGPFVPVAADASFKSRNGVSAADMASWARAHWMIYDSFIDEFCREEGDILDVGCGSGNTTLLLATVFPNSRIVGLDSDKKAIAFCRKYNAAANVEYVHAPLSRYAGRKKFRYAFACEVLEHMDHGVQERFIRDCADALTDDGLLFMTTPNEPNAVATDHHTGLLDRARFAEMYPRIRPMVKDFSYVDNQKLKVCYRGADAVQRGGPGDHDLDDGRNRSHFRLVLARGDRVPPPTSPSPARGAGPADEGGA